ncbi:uncharacterized protein LOC126397518 isoform X3 [Epinephelus moara]|uniref:uncharacterized protein LOC126397518 isoform X3 n=1 Tax=Epinephelus moara TaxID=300413 RepID=UPI00214E15B2|nr:uncharacterized protein LOC126397518 isoform X3 [Epinephelus moara]
MWTSLVMSVITVQSVKMVTANMLLSVFFVSGALADCPADSALFITAPKNMEALNGSCLQIPCNYSAESGTEFDITKTTFGVWIKNNLDFANNPNNVIFNGSKANNINPIHITGNLSLRNCTTLFSSLITNYTDTYFFRIESTSFRATASCDPLQITVKDPHNTTEENTDRTITTKIQETITLSDKHDGVTITCSATYPVDGGNHKTAEERKTLNVSYAPKNTSVSISPSGPVSAGSWVNLTCSSRAKPPVSSFTWFKTSNDGPIKVFDGDFYSFNVTDGGFYYCVATNDLGNGTSPEIHLYIEGGDSSVQWAAILGGIFGILVLICLVVCVWRLKSTHSTAQQTQSQTDEQLVVEEQARKAEEEDIHYGEIDFSKRRPEASSASKQDSGQQQDVLYAQVKVSNTTNSLGQTAESPEDLYAQVKKK